jgi:hypothetical protein
MTHIDVEQLRYPVLRLSRDPAGPDQDLRLTGVSVTWR